MKQVKCPNCGFGCGKYGKTRTGKQRWYCKECNSVFTPSIARTTHEFKLFLQWLFSKNIQKDMPGNGRSFRRKTAKFWNIWPMPPKVEQSSSVVFVDGIYLARKACVLICCDEKHVLGWYVCRYEHARAWEALLSRIAAPTVVVSDGGSGFRKALKKVWPTAKLQRCVFHAFCQVRRYTTTKSKTFAGMELYELGKELLAIKTTDQAIAWTQKLTQWKIKHRTFLAEKTRDEKGNVRPTHERLLKAYFSLAKLVQTNTLFTYLDASLGANLPATNNRIEGGVNAQLRAMLRNHRGLSVERRIKAVFWWCYQHTERPLLPNEILEIMPTNKSISTIYDSMNDKSRLEKSIPTWGDAIVWSDLHNYDRSFSEFWD